ncbi:MULTISPECIES: efflux RND transporter permease subunit [Bacillus]|uniref:Efflux RND transporter permease subunit n=1 Tax=Bacillus glycinifermentans TaxID=1664069 RepID=A0AAJ4D1U1_9BACI|nr:MULTISPECIES: efflux RND transporter permease subunit [Bacillus]KKB74142.1 Swarming motility protein SwrC [Bacillus sp. TH008]MDU0070489.1 efflux RND transporter permease subunit [Bacillus sp. IG6]MED8018354.1 efflux RND transporter permease subunit [Bacillus glycinifermentans]QAT64196.1 efflux RND transporter permease subunit [Bacillus glycinifermentans]WKB78095.1 efflux RND transporter permease subunit [Bacillus glycinifermentans]
MNSIINFVLKNKFAVWLMTIIVTVAGLYAGLNMKQESIPDVNMPYLSINTTYPGAAPSQVADDVTKPIEQAVQNLDGVHVVTSTSYENASSVMIEYDYDKDMDKAKTEAAEALENVNLPDDVKDPEISRYSMNSFPILTLSVSSDKSNLQELTKNVENSLVPKLEGIEGVASVQVSGQQVEEVEFSFKEDKMKKYGLDKDTVKQVIQGSNVTTPLGLYTFGNKEKSVVVSGDIETIKDLKNMRIPVASASSASSAAAQGAQAAGGAQMAAQARQSASTEVPTVKLSEIASIKDVKKAESISRTNGKDSIGINIVKANDANTVEVADNVKKELKQFKEDHKGFQYSATLDMAEPITQSVETMLDKAIFGALFAVVIILLFLRDIKSTLISIVSIPLSLLIALLVLNQLDITLNIMTLGAMTVAIGRVVDDSIVVIENIYRRMRLKDEPLRGKALVREATKEMFKPIMSSTIVTIAVFLPLALVGGQIGELFIPFALAIVFALAASLLISITLVPMLAHSLFKKSLTGAPVKGKEHKPGRLANAYKKILNWALSHKWITSIIAILMLLGSLFLVPLIGASYLPSEEEKTIQITYTPEPGETKKEAEDEAAKAEKLLLDRKHVDTVQYSLGSSSPLAQGNSNGALFYIKYEDDTPDFDKEKDNVLKEIQKKSKRGEWKTQNFNSSGNNNELTYYVYGDSEKDIKGTVKDIEKIMKDQKDLKNVKSGLSSTYDEYTFVADQEKLSKLGLTASQISQALMTETSQAPLTTVKKDGKELDVNIKTEKDEYKSVKDLENKKLTSATGQEVKIGDVAKVKEGITSDTVSKRDGKVYADVTGEIKTDNITKVSSDVQKKIDKLDLPDNVTIDTGGVSADIADSFTKLGLAMLAAVAIVYLVLVITFGGALAPFAILFSLPFTVIGALIGLYVSGETISLNAMIGMLMLIGIVVTNAIVLIDRVIHKEAEGLSTREALLEAGSTRLRPILMTAIATIGALIPLALGFEGGSQVISKGLGVTVIGGLISSTLLTLVIVPIVYEILAKFRRKKPGMEEE